MGFLDNIGAAFGLTNAGTGRSAALAENEFLQQAIAQMQNRFAETQENLLPFLAAGTEAIPGVVEGSTVGGLDERLGRIFNSNIFGELVDERTRAAEGQLAAGGLTRSGTALQEIANIPTQVGLGIEDLLSGRLQGLAGSGQNAAAQLGGFAQNQSAGIANLLGRQGSNVGSGIITDAQAQAAGLQNLQETATTAAAMFFSDPALKENVKPISKIGDLTLVEWDWIPEARGKMIEKCGTMGFMADEVKEKYPEYVSEYGGFMVIAYPALLNALEAKWVQHGHA